MAQVVNKKYRITPRVRNDLLNIGRYTERTWGKTQRNIYFKEIETRFQWLADNPLLGKHRTDINNDYYSFPQGQHVVFYLIDNNIINIIAVPHKEMDIISYFQN